MQVVIPNAELDARMRAWLAEALMASAAWRQGKKAEYPNDERNLNSMVALHSAASYVRQKHGLGMSQMLELYAACVEVEFPLVTYPGPQSERVAGRYGFDRVTPPLDDPSHTQLLCDVFVASLEDLRDALEDDIPSGSRLEQLIAKHLAARPASPEETAIALLAEIRDLLRDRLPVAAVESSVES
jgi:hypothetical protein